MEAVRLFKRNAVNQRPSCQRRPRKVFIEVHGLRMTFIPSGVLMGDFTRKNIKKYTLGYTEKQDAEIFQFIRSKRYRFNDTSHNPVNNNCYDFCEVVVDFLDMRNVLSDNKPYVVTAYAYNDECDGPPLSWDIFTEWNTSIVIYDKEISYSENNGLVLKQFDQNSRNEGTLTAIGFTSTNLPEIQRYIFNDSVGSLYNATRYNAMWNNCNHFSNMLSISLTGSEIPIELMNRSIKRLAVDYKAETSSSLSSSS